MRALLSRRFGVRVGVMIVSGSLLVVGATGGLAYRGGQRASKAAMQRDLDDIAQAMRRLCESEQALAQKQKRARDVSALRQAIMDTKVGATGYVFVLSPDGKYVISQGGKRDGEDIWEAKDADGNLFIQAMCKGREGWFRYPWKNQGDTKARTKMARTVYYEPWQWIIGVGAYEDDLDVVGAALKSAISTGAVAGAAIAWIIALLLSRSVLKPIQMVNAGLEDLVSGDADLTRRLDESRQDEIGDLSRRFNTFVAKLEGIIAEVAASAEQAAAQSEEMSAGAEEAYASTEQLGQIVGQIAEGAQKQTQSAQGAAESMEQVHGAAKQVADGAAEQSKQIDALLQTARALNAKAEEVASSGQQLAAAAGQQARSAEDSSVAVTEMARLIGQMNAAAQQVAKAAEESSAVAREGGQTIEQTVAGMGRVAEGSAVVGEKIAQLAETSDRIGNIVEMIDSIAEQTNLLALNAAIEAARAGEHGKGFAVVAEEVRKLAERSAQSTQEIGTLITGIRKAMAEAQAAMERGSRDVEEGTKLADAAGSALQQILAAVDGIRSQAEGIAGGMAQVTEGSRKVSQSIESIAALSEESSASTQEIAAAAQEMKASTEEAGSALESIAAVTEEQSAVSEQLAASAQQTTDAVNDIVAVSEESAAGSEEMAASAKEQEKTIQEVANSAQAVAEVAQNLAKLVGQFKTRAVAQQAERPAAPSRSERLRRAA